MNDKDVRKELKKNRESTIHDKVLTNKNFIIFCNIKILNEGIIFLYIVYYTGILYRYSILSHIKSTNVIILDILNIF